MKMTGNTILITGGGSGIGLALAEEFAKLGNTVLVAGRSPEKLAVAAKKGFKTYPVDMTNAESIQAMAKKVLAENPNLNVVVQNAGIMEVENLIAGGNTRIQDETIATNLLGPMRLNDALLPHLLKQSAATIMTVSSGLAFLPLAQNPTYCATKAAIHSYSQSLRYQLKDTSVRVIELPPPYVQTYLGGEAQAKDPHAMPLKDFISEVMQILKDEPNATEILVSRVRELRFSSSHGLERYNAQFKGFNDMMAATRK